MANIDLFHNNVKLVYSIVSKFNVHPNDMEDITQYGMIGLLKASRQFDSSRARFSTYAYHVISNEIKRALKKNNKQCKGMIFTDFEVEPEARLAGIEESPNMEFLSPNEQKIYEMMNDGATRKEIAKKFNCSLVTLRNRIEKIKEKCQEKLEF